MKYLGFLLFNLLTVQMFAQQFITTVGKTHFFSKTPVEDIEATSVKSICAFNTTSNKVSANIPIKSFKFKDGLMESHFNENYMESDKYPSAKLSGEVLGAVNYNLDSTYSVVVKGKLDIHGVALDREIPCKLTVKGGVPVNVTSTFEVKLADHNIKIPKAVFLNIAEVIKVDIDFVLEKYTK